MYWQTYLEPAEIFDKLSILEVKLFNIHDGNKTNKPLEDILEQQFRELNNTLWENLSEKKIEEIYWSDEYIDLYNANFETFEAVEKAQKNKITAQEVDVLNHKRFLAKKKLQEKFFNQPIEEIKIGYKD